MNLLGRKPSLPVNWWRDDQCAKAFWSQDKLPAYRDLLADTVAWLDPKPGDRWLDLGCGAGRLSGAIWTTSGGRVAEVVGLDCAGANARPFEKLQESLTPKPAGRVRFLHVDFSAGLPWNGQGQFDGAVSGLAIQYAESYSEVDGKWTQTAFDGLLSDVHRLLKPGRSFVFSTNVPEPSWGRVGVDSIRGLFKARNKLRYLLKLWRIYRYGGWLKREARRGRFHYLPAEAIADKLRAVGFVDVEHKRSFAKQAFLFRCRKAGGA